MRTGFLRLPAAAIASCLVLAPAPTAAADNEARQCNPDGQFLVYGDVIAGCLIEAVADLDDFQFPGSVGETIAIVVSWTAGLGAPCVEVRDADAALVAGPACAPSVRLTPPPLPSSGIYHIVVTDAIDEQTFFFNLSIERLFPPRAPTPLAFGEVLTGREIMPVADLDVFSFNGTAGDEVRILIAATAGLGVPCVEVRAPDNAPIRGPVCGGEVDLLLRPAISGAYHVIVTDAVNNETFAYNVSVNCLAGACRSRLPSCLIDPSMDGSTLTLTITVGAPEPTQYHLTLAALGSTYPLISSTFPASDPPFVGPLVLAPFPALGRVGFLQTLTTSAGIICSDFKTVDTGHAAAAPAAQKLHRMLQGLTGVN